MDALVSESELQEPMSPQRHLIAGIGASAGGLQALKSFLGQVPPASGIAFVLVQHMAPGDDGLLLDVLSAISPVPVVTATDRTPVRADVLHIAPAGATLKIRDGRFVVRPARAPVERRTSIDGFFRSLAQDAGPCAVGIILSGCGSDGALGLERIGAAGGLIMAQKPETAGQGEMPASAALAGVDHLEPPAELARRLLAYAEHIHRLPSGGDRVARHRAIHAALGPVCDALKTATGNDFKHYKTTTLVRRLERRMQVLQIAEAGDYVERLQSDPAEARTLFRELLIGVTSFFRDRDAFDILGSKALKPLLSGRSPADELRIWVPGCATGEEAYSIAMLVREALDRVTDPPRVQVFATDIDDRALTVARRGSYPQGIAAQISAERLERFFTKKGRRYQVRPELREMCLFTAHNLVSDPPFSRLDLISCRNLLIYMGPHLQKKLFPVFHYALKSGGFLFLGSSESLAGHGELFRAVDARARLAQRKDVRGMLPGGLKDFGGQGLPGWRSPDQMAEPDLGAIAQRILLTEFAPRYAIVTDQGQIVHLSEGADKYLQPPVGSFSGTITRMARRGLSAGLRSAFTEAIQRRRTIVHELPTVQTSEGLCRVRLTVQPMPELGHHEGLYMFVFEDLGPSVRTAGDGATSRPDAEAVIEGLERELLRAREDLERAVQDQEAANEELKSSNEELLSMNEELQSANEELEASKEEVQAANRSLEQANSDLENLLRSTQIATVFLDRDGLIRTFTPAAAEIYNVRASDIGRPLDELRSRLKDLPDVPSFADIGAVTEALEHVTRHADGRWFLRRVLPYRGGDGQADGVLVTFIDISSQKRAEEQQQRATALLAAVGETTPDLIYVKDRAGRMLYANPSTLKVIGKPAEEVLGRSEPEFHTNAAEAEAIAAADEGVMRNGHTRVLDERFTSPDGVTRIFRSTKSPLRDSDGEVLGLVGVTTDVTEARAAEEALRAALEFNRRVLDSSGDCIKVLSLGGRLESMNSGGMCVMEIEDFSFVQGGTWPDLWPSEERQKCFAALDKARAGHTGRFQGFCPTARGTPRWWDVVVTPILGADGKPQKLLSISRDITDQKQAEQRLAETATIVQNMAEAFLVLGPDYRIRQVNAEASRIDGRPADQLIGRHFLEVWPEAEHMPTWPAYRTALAESVPTEVLYRHKTDHHDVWLEVRAYPVGDSLAVFYRDVNERQELQQKARAAAERVQLALDAGAIIGTWVWDLGDDRFTVDEPFAEAFGISAAHSREGLSLEQIVETVHPADKPGLLAAIDAAVATGGRFAHQYRVRRADGNYYWIEANGRVDKDADGTPRRFPGVLLDVEERRAVEAERDRALSLLRAFADAVPGVVYAKDRDGRMLVANRGTTDLIGKPPEFYIGKTDAEFLDDSGQAEAVMANDARIMASDVIEQLEEEVSFPDGRRATWLSTKAPFRDEAGEVIGLIGASIDISARKEAEAALAESEQRFRFALDAAGGIGTWDWDIANDRVFASAQFAQMYGLDPARAEAGLSVAEYVAGIHNEDRPQVQRLIEEAVDTGKEYRAEYRIMGRDGEVRWVIARGRCMQDADGTPRRFPGVTFDITERKRAETALRETSRRLDAILANSTMAVFLMDERQHCVFANTAAEKLTGYSFADMLGRPLHDVVHHKHPDGSHYPLEDCPIDRAFPERAQMQGEELFVAPDGSFYPVAFTASPVLDDDGRPIGTIIEARNIADEKAARAALAESEARFRTIANAMPQMVWSTSADGRHDFFNEQWYRFTGVPHGSTDGDGWNGAFHPEDQERAWAAWQHCLATGEPYEVEYRLRRHGGEYCWVLGRALPVRNEAGEIIRWMGTCTDIHDLKEVQAALQEREVQLRTLLDIVPVGIVLAELPSGRILESNTEAERMLGSAVLASQNIDNHDQWLSHHADGTLVDPSDYPLARMASLGEEAPEIEVRLQRGDGSRAWTRLMGRAVRNTAGAMIGGVLALVDTERQRRTEAELAAALEEKEALLYEVNHRVKNNLQVVTSLLTMQASQSRSAEVKRDLADARARIGVIASIHQSLYSTSRHSEVEMASFLQSLAQNVVRSLGDGRIALIVSGGEQAVLPLKQAMPLALIVSELLTNAVKYAFPNRRTGTIELGLHCDAEAYCVEIADDGIGLPESFDPSRSAGVGMKVIGVLARQLRAAFEPVKRSQGALFRVTVPLR